MAVCGTESDPIGDACKNLDNIRKSDVTEMGCDLRKVIAQMVEPI